MDNIKFSIKIEERDLYRFNLHHIYTSSQGIISIILFLLLIVIWIMKFQEFSLSARLIYPVGAMVVLFYIPMSLKLRAKAQMTQEVFLQPLSYLLKDDGIEISSPASEEPAELPWEYVYKISTWKEYLLIYSNRINAYIIPKRDIVAEYNTIVAFIKSHVEDYKLQIK